MQTPTSRPVALPSVRWSSPVAAMFAKIFCTRTISARAKHLAALAVPFVFFIAAPPVVAQQQGAPSTPAAPYYGSMTWGWSGRPGWDLHPFMMVVLIVSIFGLLILVGIMLIFIWLVRWGTHFHPFHGRGGASHDILEERFARGEIDKAEFEDKGRLLSR